MTLSKLDEGIVKINSKVLESSELKKFDKLEKEGITSNGSVLKGKVSGYIWIHICHKLRNRRRRLYVTSSMI